MDKPRTIDSGSRDFADAIREADSARRHGHNALELNQACSFYLGNKHGLTPDQAVTRADDCRSHAFGHAEAERQALASLNGIMARAGGRSGDVFLVGRGLYRVCKPGLMAVYLGENPPGYEEIVAAFEPIEAPDERDEDMFVYGQMVHLPR